MRYQSINSFQKHLADSAPHNLCRMYLMAIPDDFERAQAIDLTVSYLGSPVRFSGTNLNMRDFFDATQNRTFLSDEPVVVLDELDKLSKKEQQTLSENFSYAHGFIVFGTRSKTALAAPIEKNGVILDLLEEKPWDKEKRLAVELIKRAEKAGKKCTSESQVLLFERLGSDPALLMSEMDKLICFIGDRTVIQKEDVLAISAASRVSSHWQMAEEVVWDNKGFHQIDTNTFHALLPMLRYQLQQGLTLATLIEEKRPPEEWSSYLSKIKTKQSSLAARFGTSYFRKALQALFEIELLSRDGSNHYRSLLELFRAKSHDR